MNNCSINFLDPVPGDFVVIGKHNSYPAPGPDPFLIP